MFSLNWLKPKFAFILLIIFFLFIFVTQAEPYVRSDGWYYYHTAECLLNEGNFICSNKPQYWDYMDGYTKSTLNGKYVSVVAPGTSLLNLPGLFVAKVLDGSNNITNNYFWAYNGHSIYDGIAILVTSSLFCIFTLILIYKILRLLKFSEKNSIISTVSVFISSYALWYVFLLPIFTHTYEAFSVALMIWSFLLYKQHKKIKYLILTGAAVGLSVLIRPVLLPIGLTIGLFILLSSSNLTLKRNLQKLGQFILGGLPFLLIYFAYNLISYGKLISSGYDAVRGETFNFSQFNGLNILFSPQHGLFIFSPIYIFALIGLILLYKRNKILSIISIVSIFSIVLIYSFWPNWWGGGTYGARFFIFSFPIFTIGLAEFFSKIGKLKVKLYKLLLILLSAVFILYSALLLFSYRFTPLNDDQFETVHMLRYQYDLLKESSSISDYASKLINNVQGSSGILAILTGTSNPVLRVYEDEDKIKSQYFTPPYQRRESPSQIEFYLVNNKTKLVYYGELTDLKKLDIICNSTCVSNSKKLTLKRTIGLGSTLPVSKYVGIKLEKLNYSIYFKIVKNQQFRGNIISWEPSIGLYYI